MPERKFASTGDQTHNHQVTSPTSSPLSHTGGRKILFQLGQGHIMAVGDTHVFSGFLTPVLTQFFFPKPPTTFLTYFYRGERRKYAWKKVCLNRGSNSQPPGHESNQLTTEPHRRAKNLISMTYNFKPLQTLSYLNLWVFLIGDFFSRETDNLKFEQPWRPLKDCGKKEKMLIISMFSCKVLCPLNWQTITSTIISAKFKLSPVNAFRLNQSKIL